MNFIYEDNKMFEHFMEILHAIQNGVTLKYSFYLSFILWQQFYILRQTTTPLYASIQTNAF